MKKQLLLILSVIGLPLLAQNKVVLGRITTFNTFPVAHVEITSKKARPPSPPTPWATFPSFVRKRIRSS
ncbi:MAG: hypothetical protein R2751_11665 [Bacteroidales bacterium]